MPTERQITISEKSFKRLQACAEPLVDTIEDVIIRLLDAYTVGQGDNGIRVFDPSQPPDLRHTTPMSAKINGRVLSKPEIYWNNILVVLVKELAKKGLKPVDISAVVTSNNVVGRKTDNGYKFIREAGISLQGLDANSAWKTIHWVAVAAGITLELKFRWQNKEDLDMSGVIGCFNVPPNVAKAV